LEYEIDTDYHEINRLQYRFRFEPIGAEGTREIVDLTVAPENLEIDLTDPENILVDELVYDVALPAGMSGRYRLTLYVEDIDGVLDGDETRLSEITIVEGTS
jgi:hypothetical protein